MKTIKKPKKKTDKELFDLLDTKIANAEYVFKKHARQRQDYRRISDLEVLDILEGKNKRSRHRNKKEGRIGITVLKAKTSIKRKFELLFLLRVI